MGLIKKSNELVIPSTVKMMIFGSPGMGKTTVALSALKPLLLDFDNGVKVSTWLTSKVSTSCR